MWRSEWSEKPGARTLVRLAPPRRPAAGASGTAKRTTPIAASESTPVIAKMPGTPIEVSSQGPRTKEAPKTTPIVEPMIAIVLVRWLSRVRSAASAITVPEMAPAPWSARPRIIDQGASEAAQTKLPAAMQARPP